MQEVECRRFVQKRLTHLMIMIVKGERAHDVLKLCTRSYSSPASDGTYRFHEGYHEGERCNGVRRP